MKFRIFYSCILVLALMSSCRHSRYRTVTIALNDNTRSVKIKYEGTVSFNADSTAISSLSPQGYITYRSNAIKMRVESDEAGRLTTALFENGTAIPFNEYGTKLMAAAIKEMLALGVH
jgi:hypothetical protein